MATSELVYWFYHQAAQDIPWIVYLIICNSWESFGNYY